MDKIKSRSPTEFSPEWKTQIFLRSIGESVCMSVSGADIPSESRIQFICGQIDGWKILVSSKTR